MLFIDVFLKISSFIENRDVFSFKLLRSLNSLRVNGLAVRKRPCRSPGVTGAHPDSSVFVIATGRLMRTLRAVDGLFLQT
jgi:hypothetical protein